MSSLLRAPYYSCRGVDGIFTNDSIMHTLDATTEWWCVDLKKTCNFREIILYNRNGSQDISNRIIGFKLRISTSGQCDKTTFNSSSLCYKDQQLTGQLVYNIKDCNQIPSIQFSSRLIFISPKHNEHFHFRELVVKI
ncbi:hypothetical protein LOTGIDRAFT_174517 [Lottia gigantea]|uniref:F5/8 type C domain-containing protein n=1 Tax=Lottia gigantea TaxID=225164 RepID=V4A098_LOTGI|nr:hypothetical protein LOTGIDRAFT_174517 [Lottia gigantea]ESO97233.1 hypothetical protein LOTGIDRAFT_174517 [Lottia gigantea]